MKPFRKSLAILSLIALATLAIYLRTLSFDFVAYDDPVYVTENAHVQAGLTWDGVVYAFTTGETGTWQPLTLLSHMLDYSLYGKNAGGHHATSAILHALNTFLLGLVLLRMTGAAGPSLFAAAVFGLHPLHVESVAWISERKDVLSTLFFMATIYAYAIWGDTNRKRWLAIATGCMALGLLAKPMLVTLPFVLLLLDYWPLQRVRNIDRLRCIALLVAEKLPMFVCAAASSLATLAVQRGAQATTTLDALSLLPRIENAIVAYVRYVGKTIWPTDLLMYYPHPRESLSVLQVGASLAYLIVVTAAVWFVRRRARYAWIGWLWYLGTLVPVIGIVQVGTQAIADRYMYIPMIGLLILASWGVRDVLGGAGRRALPALSIVVVALLATATWTQIGVWRNSETLYRHTLDVMPDNAVANFGLGSLLVREKQYADAAPHLELALQKQHREDDAHFSLGLVDQAMGMPKSAEEHYRAAVALNPKYSQAWNNLGVTLDSLDKRVDALDAFERAVETGPRNEEAALNLARQLARLGRIEEARQCAAAAKERLPQSNELKSLIESLDTLPPAKAIAP